MLRERLFNGGHIDGPRNWSVLGDDPKVEAMLLAKFQALDRGAKPGERLSSTTLKALQEITGLDSGKFFYRGILQSQDTDSPELRVKIARAMVLADREFGLLDEICANLLEDVFSSTYPGLRAYCFEIPGELGFYSWKDLLRGPLKSYFLPGQDLLAQDGTRRESLRLKLKAGKETVSMELAVDAVQGAHWRPTGLSTLKRPHLELISRLSAVMVDYSRRLREMDEYRTVPLIPELGYSTVEKVEQSLRLFYPETSILIRNLLRGGVSFGDDPVDLIYDRERGYVARCESCHRAVLIELVSNSMRADWISEVLYRNKSYESYPRKILALAHGKTGCEGTHSVSSRTGAREPIGEP